MPLRHMAVQVNAKKGIVFSQSNKIMCTRRGGGEEEKVCVVEVGGAQEPR